MKYVPCSVKEAVDGALSIQKLADCLENQRASAVHFPKLGRRWRFLALGLGLCALLPLQTLADEGSFFDRLLNIFGDDKEKTPEGGPDDVRYAVQFDVASEDDDLKALIRDSSNLESLRSTPPANAAGLVRRAQEDRDRVTAALYAFGYYGGKITITAAGVPVTSNDAVAAVERVRKSGAVPVRIGVEPGPQFRFGKVRFRDADTKLPVEAPLSEEALGVVAGQPANATAITAAELRLATAMRSEGYPFAAVPSREVVADHNASTVDVVYDLRRGAKAAFGDVRVEGTEKLDPDFVRDRRGFEPGDQYDPEKLAAYRKELARHDLFDSIRIIEGERLDADGRLPITVEVKERLRRFVGFGAKYSTTDGAEINVYWGHRNLFGGGERLRLDAAVTSYGTDLGNVTDFGNLGYKVSAAFGKPGILTVADDLVSQATALRERTDAYDREGVLLVAGIRRRISERLWIQAGLDVEFSHVRDAFGDNDYKLIGFPIEAMYDSTNNLLDPSRGIRINALVEPFPKLGGTTVGMFQMKGTVTAYVALDRRARWIVAGRASTGSILGASVEQLPAPRRFYVGGGGSLRGFNYQSVSPRDSSGRIIGGLSYLEASLELRVKITDTIGVVTFVDAGSAFESRYPDFKEPLRYAVGIGARYYTGIGPIRADIAIPINRRDGDARYGIYVSVGQAF